MSGDNRAIVIAPGGDLILQISHEEQGPQFLYRVDSTVLQQQSPYFKSLLSDRFSEGQDLRAATEALKVAGNISDAPSELLHAISIIHVGRISKISSIQNLTADFLRALHGHDISVANPPIANLANLAVVADRFDALPCLTRHVRRKKYLHLMDAKSKGRTPESMLEERVRQKLLIGLLFDHPPWVTRYSKYLIMHDSVQWRPAFEPDDTAALWWDIPFGIEDEIIKRREHILETVNSLQSHFLKLYSSGERQCKLGYDSSVQCDSFQLGEMVRFFSKLGTLRLQSTIYDETEPSYHSGDIDRLIESMRQCSSYQIDRNHAHCGLRVRLLPLLDLVQNQLNLEAGSLDIGICSDCWNHQRPLYAWSSAKRPVLWTLTGNRALPITTSKRGHQRTPSSCLSRHVTVRDLFMAVGRDWTGRDA
ncbi:hypothetical protein K505DRAFT_356406 [Melanomma pulvis-pyrius CBS 109.77]|uniref:BTB domain-containing protein n=1 Tax=Melanomma pulvis-pyrius CBS 109.77 TaxID=1314802 RepID=A0A6A6XTH0_9PLEO|nr:hypothetical protein K505DRAFT_356406 [Melanomma pulvis-pyrius CBS 109.77]